MLFRAGYQCELLISDALANDSEVLGIFDSILVRQTFVGKNLLFLLIHQIDH